MEKQTSISYWRSSVTTSMYQSVLFSVVLNEHDPFSNSLLHICHGPLKNKKEPGWTLNGLPVCLSLGEGLVFHQHAWALLVVHTPSGAHHTCGDRLTLFIKVTSILHSKEIILWL